MVIADVKGDEDLFTVGDYVSYGLQGVCKVEKTERRRVGREELEYLVLRPLAVCGTAIYVPVKNEKLLADMRQVLTADAIERILEVVADWEEDWEIDEECSRDFCNRSIRKADPDDLSRLVGFLYARRHRVGKRPRIHAADEHFFKEADRLLVGEFSHALNISPDEVWGLVDKKIRKVEKTS